MSIVPASDFQFSELRDPHWERRKSIIRQHPEIRAQFGRNPGTLAIVFAVVALQLGLCFLLRAQPWWLVLAAAYGIGAFANHALWVMIHECAHNLIFSRKWMNSLAGMIANIPQVFPSSVSFQRYHLNHHAFQGMYELDADVPDRWEARLVGNSRLRKTLWLAFMPILQVSRTMRLKKIRPIDGWIAANVLVQLGANALVLYFFGPRALLYLLASFLFSVGVHPLGARWIQEHYLVFSGQETTSYYGPLNSLALNVGYHNEHHDFPSVPWNRLPAVRDSARESYDGLKSHRSWTGLLFRFLVDPGLSPYDHQIRADRASGPAVRDEHAPDRALPSVGDAAGSYPNLTV